MRADNLFAAAVFVALAAGACEPGTTERPAAPTSKTRPPDRTEVTMEVSPVDGVDAGTKR